MNKNIIFISMEACGASLIAPLISQMYEVFYGKRIYWNYEISRLIACSNDYIFPKGFTSVYYVDPRRVLERPFDKVIILQRPLEEIRIDIYERLGLKKPIDKVDKKIEFYYNLIYNQEIEDKKLFKIVLQEFCNYPVASFSDLFDFLEFPKKYRPMIFPLPIWHLSEDKEYKPFIPPLHRDWKKRSTILRKGHEEGLIEKDEYTQMVNVEQGNPYKHTSIEYTYQDGRTYRLMRSKEEGGIMVDVLEVLGYLK